MKKGEILGPALIAIIATGVLSAAIYLQSESSVANRLANINSYANCYKEYTQADLENLKKFDIVVIDPYDVPDQSFVSELKQADVIVLAYIDIGEAENTRAYWENMDNSLILAPNPDWPGCYYADVNNQRWHDIILDNAIPYIFECGDYDGLCMDMLDTIDIYPELKPGMISLIAEIREEYPDLILVPNRGFGILPEISPYIDAFKYEEMSARYDFENEMYVYGEDEEEMNTLLSVLENHEIPVLVLDHVETNPPDENMAQTCYERTTEIAAETGHKFVWYANSVEQDLPIWSFLPLRS